MEYLLVYIYQYGDIHGRKTSNNSRELRIFILSNPHLTPISIVMIRPDPCVLISGEVIRRMISEQKNAA